MRDRRAEDRHHGVSHEFLDKALIALDRGGHQLEQVALKLPDVLWVQSLTKSGEA